MSIPKVFADTDEDFAKLDPRIQGILAKTAANVLLIARNIKDDPQLDWFFGRLQERARAAIAWNISAILALKDTWRETLRDHAPHISRVINGLTNAD